MIKALVDGIPAVSLPLDDRGLNYGDGLFETMRVADGCPRFLSLHLARLERDARRLRIPCPDGDELREQIGRLCDGQGDGVLKLILTRGSGGRGYRPAADARGRVILTLHPAPDWPEHWSREGIAVRWCATRLASQPALAGIKHLNRLEQVLARAEWADTEEWQEGLMCDQTGGVIEATQANLFLIHGGRLSTPRLDECGITGIMRGVVIETARQLEIHCEEVPVTRKDVENANEIFLCNSVIGICPIRQVGDHQVRAPGLVTQTIAERVACEPS